MCFSYHKSGSIVQTPKRLNHHLPGRWLTLEFPLNGQPSLRKKSWFFLALKTWNAIFCFRTQVPQNGWWNFWALKIITRYKNEKWCTESERSSKISQWPFKSQIKSSLHLQIQSVILMCRFSALQWFQAEITNLSTKFVEDPNLMEVCISQS